MSALLSKTACLPTPMVASQQCSVCNGVSLVSTCLRHLCGQRVVVVQATILLSNACLACSAGRGHHNMRRDNCLCPEATRCHCFLLTAAETATSCIARGSAPVQDLQTSSECNPVAVWQCPLLVYSCQQAVQHLMLQDLLIVMVGARHHC